MSIQYKYAFYRNTLRSISRLNWRTLYLISDVLRFVLYRIVRYRRDIVRQNLLSSFPEKSQSEVIGIEKQFYRQLCDTMVETVKLLTISRESLKERIEVQGGELIDANCTPEHPAILYTAHYGNWEWVPSIQFFYSPEIVSGEIYKPLRDKVMDRLLKDIRTRLGSVLISQKSALREIVRMKKESKRFIVGFVADHRLNSQYSSLHMDFLNHRNTPFAAGPEKIGNHVGAKYYYLHVAKPHRGKYIFRISPMTPRNENVEFPYTHEYGRLLEENIYENPSLWLWSHRRWLYH